MSKKLSSWVLIPGVALILLNTYGIIFTSAKEEGDSQQQTDEQDTHQTKKLVFPTYVKVLHRRARPSSLPIIPVTMEDLALHSPTLSISQEVPYTYNAHPLQSLLRQVVLQQEKERALALARSLSNSEELPVSIPPPSSTNAPLADDSASLQLQQHLAAFILRRAFEMGTEMSTTPAPTTTTTTLPPPIKKNPSVARIMTTIVSQLLRMIMSLGEWLGKMLVTPA